jgi:hypothetical protein
MTSRIKYIWNKAPLPLISITFFAVLIITKIAIVPANFQLGMLIVGGLTWLFLTRLEFDFFTSAALCLGMLGYWWWFCHSGINFSPDIDGHLQYIGYMSSHLIPPPPFFGFLFYHPPLYYNITGLISSFFIEDHMTRTAVNIIRVFSLACFFSFLIYGIRTIQLANLPYPIYVLCVLLLVFWPSGFMISSRIDSNLLLYPFCAISFYYALKWYHMSSDTKLLARALIFVSFGIITRTNAVVVAAVLCSLVIYNLALGKISFSQLKTRAILISIMCVLVATGINLGRNIYYRETANINMPMVIGNQDQVLHWRIFTVGNRPDNFLRFNSDYYLAPPFYIPTNDSGGRQYFSIVFLKSMLWGDQFLRAGQLAKYTNAYLLLFMIFVIAPVFFYRVERFEEKLPIILLVFLSIAGLAINRYNMPVGPSSDFRYTYYALPALIMLFGYHLDAIHRRKYILYYFMFFVALALLYSGDKVYLIQFLPSRFLR